MLNLDTKIHKHLDVLDKLEDNIVEEIDAVMEALDIDEIMDDPAIALTEVTTQVKRIILDEYADKAVKEGSKFGYDLEHMKRKLKVVNTKNPTLNEDFENDKSKDKGKSKST